MFFNSRIKHSQVFIIFIVCISYVLSQTQTNLKVGDTINKVSLKTKEVAHYKLHIGDEYYQDEDLIIKVIPLDYDSDPDIYISRSVEFPNSSLDADWQCSSYGKDTCTINQKNLTRGKDFYIGVVCLMRDCQFSLKTMFTSEFQLEDGVEFQTYLFREDARVFKYTIPSQINDDTSITIKASAYRGTVHDFTLTVASKEEGISPGTGIFQVEGTPAWKKGQVIRINKNNFYGFCKGCEIKILLDVYDEGYYHIMVQTTESQPLLQNGDQIDDLVGFQERQCYKYYIKGENTDVQVQLTTYSGRIQMNINPGQVPDDWEAFALKGDSNDTEVIQDLGPRFRSHRLGQVTGLYYICVKGDLVSTYSLKVREFDFDHQAVTNLEDGYSETFFIGQGWVRRHLYKVPKLEYTDEDIKIEFDFTLRRGNVDLILAAKMCLKNNTNECTDNLTADEINKEDSGFQIAQNTGSKLKLVIDHDESQCSELLDGECNYVIVVINPTQSRAVYKIVGSHLQNNHILLQENVPHIDSIDLHKIKYLKFSLFEDPSVQNITFEITPLHGDSDLFISRTLPFPDRENFDKKSQRIGSLVDHITFTKEDLNKTTATSQNNFTSLSGTYYIGVYGYSYSTFSVLVNVKRQKQSVTEQFKQQATVIYEGFPITKTLHNEFDAFFGYFEVDIPDDEDSTIIIDIVNKQSKTKSYIKYGAQPSSTVYDFKISDGILKIKPNDQGYHKKGTYYIATLPDFNLLDLFRDNYYTFSINWRLQNTLPNLNTQLPLTLVTRPYTYSYLRHFVQEVEDIRISASSLGHIDLFVSLHPDQKQPTNDTYDFTTKFNRGGNHSTWKSLRLPMGLIQENNPACKDLGYAEDNTCVLYISVLCQENYECTSEIEVDYESQTPRKIYSGQNKHQEMFKDSQNYYYLSINSQNYDDVYGILQPQTGDADLFVNIQILDKTKDIVWDLPSEQNNVYQSKTKLNTEMVHITKDQLKEHCKFADNTGDNQEQDKDCLIIFGILPAEDDSEDPEIIYNFVAYKSVMEIKDLTPAYGYVKEGDFSYFLYKETCDDCNIIVSLSSYQNGDPEIYITKGTKLPSKTEFDIKRQTINSEIVTLNLEDDFLKRNNVTSMADYYIIGVYGTKNTTFQLSITSQDDDISQLEDGVEIKHSQKAYSIVYFQYYHMKQKDIEIQLSVSQGAADIYVTTFNTISENFLEKLPQKKDDAIWYAQDINSINQVEGKEILILQTDQKYCQDCYYIVGVVTHEGSAKYSINLNTIEAEKSYTHLLRLGMTKMIKLEGVGSQQIYQFMLESKDPAQIVPTIISGNVKISVSFYEDINQAFISQRHASPISLKGDSLQTERNYYVFVESTSENAELTLTIHQNLTIITLYDGVPQVLSYQDYQDVSKLMVFHLPAGNSTVQFNVRSKTEFFFPILMVYYMNANLNELIFPPSKTILYNSFTEWDEDLYVMKVTMAFQNVAEDSSLNMNLFYNNRRKDMSGWDPSGNTSASAIITVSHTRIVKIVPNEDYYGQLNQGMTSFQLFKIQAPKGKITHITFSDCVGMSTFSIVADPGKLNERKKIEIMKVQGGQEANVKELDGENYILVEPIGFVFDFFNREFLIRVDYLDSLDYQNKLIYMPQNEGQIQYEYLRTHQGNVKLKWSPLMKYTIGNQVEQAQNVRYKLVFSTNPNAVMDQVCAIKKSTGVFKIYEDKDGDNEYITRLNPGESTQFNVIAMIDQSQIAIPYKALTLKVPKHSVYGGGLVIGLLLIALIMFGVVALYYFFKGKKLEQKLNDEVREIAGSEGYAQTYHKVQDIKSDASDYNGKCATCVLTDSSYYYCTKNNTCSSSYIDYYSCEKGIRTCLFYESSDLGIKEIPPFEKTYKQFNYTINNGESLRFAISNQDSKSNAWVQVQLYNSSDSTTALTSAPSYFHMYYYDQTNGNLTNYIFASTGKSYLKALNTRFYYVASSSDTFTISITYGNTSKWASLNKQITLITLLLVLLLTFLI